MGKIDSSDKEKRGKKEKEETVIEENISIEEPEKEVEEVSSSTNKRKLTIGEFIIFSIVFVLYVIGFILYCFERNTLEENNSVSEVKKDPNFYAILEEYAKSVETEVSIYVKEKGKLPKFSDIQADIPYSKHRVSCAEVVINDDETVYLGQCVVDGEDQTDLTYGNKEVKEEVHDSSVEEGQKEVVDVSCDKISDVNYESINAGFDKYFKQIENVDYTEINDMLNKYFMLISRFDNLQLSKLAGSMTGARIRIELVNTFITLDKEYCTSSFYVECLNGNGSCSEYVNQDFYEKKYQAIFGNNYKFAEDLKDMKIDLTAYNDKYYFYGADGSFQAGKYVANKIVKEGNQYILSGNFVKTYDVDVTLSDGTAYKKGDIVTYAFKVIYSEENGNRYLKDFIIS